jgi:hypothetical protein
VTIEEVEEAKLLCITLDDKLSWSSHIDRVVVKMGRGYVCSKNMISGFDTKIICTSCSGSGLVPS